MHLKNTFLSLFLVIIFSLSILFSGCFSYKYNDKATLYKFSKKGNEIEVLYYKKEERSIRYVKSMQKESKVKKKHAVLFIHGSPGSSKDFKAYLRDTSLSKKADLYAVDRPGYGNSNWGKVITSIYDQSTYLKPLVDSLGKQYDSLILVGHSYGGPVAAALPFMSPDEVKKVILIAPALDPELEKIFWFSPLGKYKSTRWLTPKALKMAADEKFSHAEALEELWEKLEGKTYNGEVLHVHGDKDFIVNFDNIRFTKKRFRKVKIRTVEGGNHYIPFNAYSLIVGEIEGMI